MTKALSVSFAISLFLAVFLFGAYAFALPARAAAMAQPACVTLDKNLYRGVSSSTFGHYVSSLQHFLHENGYLDASYTSAAGSFGPMTFGAVVRFQKAEGLPATGYVGTLTRARIMQRWCGGTPSSTVSVYGISPSSVHTGDTVNVTGFGFTSSNTVLIDGMVAAKNVPVSSSIAVACTDDPSCKGGIRQTLSFALPDSLSPNCPAGSMCPLYLRLLQPGTYALTVQNTNGTSNSAKITVGDAPSGGTLSIAGLDTPTSLPIGVSGSWMVRVNASSHTGTLHYSVRWGDEPMYLSLGIRAPDTTSVQTDSTFTHTYRYTGTYTPAFTVADDYGHSATASASVTVTPIY